MARKRSCLAASRLAVERDFQAFKKRQAAWVKARLAVLPYHWRKRAAREYERLLSISEQAGNSWLREASAAARGGRLSIASSDEEIRAEAIRAALEGIELVAHSGAADIREARRILEDHARAWGVEPPPHPGDPGTARLLCERWWLRRLRAGVARQCEALAIRARLVCRGVWPYASQDGVERRKDQKRRNALALERAALVDLDSGERVALADVVAGSVANPPIRRGELMVRIRGAEEWATAAGWVAEFWTVTAPSRFHAQRMAGVVSEPNPLYDGSSPAQAQAYLCGVWARVRAAWKRRGLRVAGVRVAEPHHDGTPHWHILVFGPARDLRYARRLLAVYARRDSPGEPGAKQHRFKADKIDPAKGDAAGYVAKYVAKNIDGFGVGVDEETGRKAGAMVRRCDAWAAAWRVRQFQFFGLPAVSVWRELRRMREPVEVEAVEAARSAADEANFCEFIRALGGAGIRYRDASVWLLRESAGPLTEYGDEGARRPVGVAAAGGAVPVKRGNFSILWGGLGVPRTRVNNCTPSTGAAVQGAIDMLMAWGGNGGAGGIRPPEQYDFFDSGG